MHTADVPNTSSRTTPAARATSSRRSGSRSTPLSYIGWGKTTQLGYGLGLAMGAKLAQPDKLCMNMWGDAAIGMTGMDFETGVRANIPIMSILFNNFSMAMELPVMKISQREVRLDRHLRQLRRLRQGPRRLRRAHHGPGRDHARAQARHRSDARKARPCCWSSSPRRTRCIPPSRAATGS